MNHHEAIKKWEERVDRLLSDVCATEDSQRVAEEEACWEIKAEVEAGRMPADHAEALYFRRFTAARPVGDLAIDIPTPE